MEACSNNAFKTLMVEDLVLSQVYAIGQICISQMMPDQQNTYCLLQR